MRTKFFCTNFLNTARGPGHPGKIPGTSRIPLFETQGRQSFEGGHEVFGHHPFAWKTPTPPGGLRTQKLNLCALFSGLILVPLRGQCSLGILLANRRPSRNSWRSNQKQASHASENLKRIRFSPSPSILEFLTKDFRLAAGLQ